MPRCSLFKDACLPPGMAVVARRYLMTREDPYANLTTEGVLTGLGDTKLRSKPGERAHYSNLGGGLLGHALAGAGALHSTTTDLAAFLRAQLGLIDTPLATAIAKTHDARSKLNGRADFCLGWIRIRGRDRAVMFHNGGTGGYRSFIAFAPERHVGVAVLSSTARSVDGLGFSLIRALAS